MYIRNTKNLHILSSYTKYFIKFVLKKNPQEFVRSIKMKDRKIRNAASIDDSLDESLPPVRSVSMAGETAEAIDSLKSIKNNSKRIVSSDYREWDKYDAGMSRA